MSVSPHPVPLLALLPLDSTSLLTTHPYRRCPNQQLKQLLQVPDYLFKIIAEVCAVRVCLGLITEVCAVGVCLGLITRVCAI